MTAIAEPLLKWFDIYGRKNLPWQENPVNPYHVWLSEVMLQQTQVTTVIGYFNNFLQHFPTLTDLANADEDAVLAQWAGLGYYARARNLLASAQIISADYQGKFPQEFKQVLALPGVGESTAGAILALSFGQNHTILDGNVKRVLARYHQVEGHYGQSVVMKKLWNLARQHTPNTRTADYTQAIMDLGATLCTRSKPDCGQCPLAQNCQAKIHNTQTRYPNPKPRKIKPTRSTAMLIYTNPQGEIYLEKRPAKGIWGGLWSFSECKDDDNTIRQTTQDFCKKSKILRTLPMVKHTFTHYHLLISPVMVYCTANKDFQPIAKIKVGLPAPVDKIVNQLLNNLK